MKKTVLFLSLLSSSVWATSETVPIKNVVRNAQCDTLLTAVLGRMVSPVFELQTLVNGLVQEALQHQVRLVLEKGTFRRPSLVVRVLKSDLRIRFPVAMYRTDDGEEIPGVSLEAELDPTLLYPQEQLGHLALHHPITIKHPLHGVQLSDLGEDAAQAGEIFNKAISRRLWHGKRRGRLAETDLEHLRVVLKRLCSVEGLREINESLLKAKVVGEKGFVIP